MHCMSSFVFQIAGQDTEQSWFSFASVVADYGEPLGRTEYYGELGLTLIKFRTYPYRHIFVYLYFGYTVTASKRTIWKNGKKYATAMSK